jgi:3-mercaptopyruvate sulfurtransferase SseA
LLGGFDAWRKAGYPLEPKTTAPKADPPVSQRTKEVQENLQKAADDPAETD